MYIYKATGYDTDKPVSYWFAFQYQAREWVATWRDWEVRQYCVTQYRAPKKSIVKILNSQFGDPDAMGPSELIGMALIREERIEKERLEKLRRETAHLVQEVPYAKSNH